jgi:hypothetical protein
LTQCSRSSLRLVLRDDVYLILGRLWTAALVVV